MDFATTSTTVTSSTVSLDADFTLQILYIVIGIVGVSGNSIVITVILSSRQLRRFTTNILIANQSAIDLTVSLFIVLTSLIRDVTALSGGDVAREVFCRLWMTNLPIWGLFVGSTYNLLAITVERYLAIVYPLKHSTSVSGWKTRLVLASSWLAGVLYNAAYMIPTSAYRQGECTVYSEWPSVVVQTAVGLLTIFVQYFVPLIVMIFAYSRIVFALRRMTLPGESNAQQLAASAQQRVKRMIRARRNVVKTLVTVSLCFVLCWSPNQILYTMYNLGVSVDFNGAFYHFTVIAVFLNSCVNPFVYALQYEQFKNVIFRRCKRQDGRDDYTTGRTVGTGHTADHLVSTISSRDPGDSMRADGTSPGGLQDNHGGGRI